LEQVLWIAQAEEALQRLALVGQYGGILAQRRKEEAEKLWESGVRKEEIPAPKEGQKKEMGIGIDGMMVWVDDGWHEVKVGCCFEFGTGKDGEVKARNIGYWAGYGDVEVFRRTLWSYAYHRGLGLEGKAVVIGDGASWIVDWYHAVERLWGLGREAFGERASEWVEKVKEWLWEGRVEEVVRECESEGVARTAEYFRERREQMDYPAFRKAGYPIGRELWRVLAKVDVGVVVSAGNPKGWERF